MDQEGVDQEGVVDQGGATTVNRDVGCTTGDICPACGADDLRPERAHVKCPSCGYIGPCCW